MILTCQVFAEGQEVGALPEIVVQEEGAGSTSELDKSSVVPTIKLPKKKLEQKKAPTLSEAIAG